MVFFVVIEVEIELGSTTSWHPMEGMWHVGLRKFTFLRGKWGVPWKTFLVLNEKYWKSQQCHQNSWINSCWDALGGVSESEFFYDVSQHYRTKLDKWKIYHLNKHLYQTLFTKIIQASENGWHYLFQFRKKENKTIKTGFTTVSLPRSTLVVPCPPVRWG